MPIDKQEAYFKDWKSREEIAEAMVPLVGRLYRNHGVITTVYGRSLVHGSTIDILKAHRFARQISKPSSGCETPRRCSKQ